MASSSGTVRSFLSLYNPITINMNSSYTEAVSGITSAEVQNNRYRGIRESKKEVLIVKSVVKDINFLTSLHKNQRDSLTFNTESYLSSQKDIIKNIQKYSARILWRLKHLN